MSECEQFAQIAQHKRVNKQIAHKNEQLAQKIWINSYFLQTPKARSDHLILTVSEYLIELFETLLETGIIL